MFVTNGAVAKHTKNAHKRCPVYSYIYTTQQTKNRDKTKIDTMDILHMRGRQGSITGDKEVNYKLYLE